MSAPRKLIDPFRPICLPATLCRFSLILFICGILVACDRTGSNDSAESSAGGQRVGSAPVQVETFSLLGNPLNATIVECPTEAIPVWRSLKAAKPSLVLLSDRGLFAPVPEPIRKRATSLVRNGSSEEFWESSPGVSSDPVLAGEMVLSAVAEEGFFEKIYWILPVRDENRGALTSETLAQALRDTGVLPEDSIAALRPTKGGFSTAFRGIPLQMLFSSALPRIVEPVVIHIDLDYFDPLYQNEVKSPLLILAQTTLEQIATSASAALAVTVSRSNYSGHVPLERRFLADFLAGILAEPALLGSKLPPKWELLSRNLYLEEFFQPGEMIENARRLVELEPDQGYAFHALYKGLSAARSESTYQALREAVRFDPVYAIEYLRLFDRSMEKEDGKSAIEFLKAAVDAMPWNPGLKFDLARVLAEQGETDEALQLLEELSRLTWSEFYYPDIRQQTSIQ